MTDIHQTELSSLLCTSRATVLDMLRRRGYDTAEYDTYSPEDIDAKLRDHMENSALDMRVGKVAAEGVNEGRLPFTVVKYRIEKIKSKLHSLFTPPVDTTGLIEEDEEEDEEDDDVRAAARATAAAKATKAAAAKRRKAPAREKSIWEGFDRTTDELVLIIGEPVGEAFHKAAHDAFSKHGVRVSMFYVRDLIVNRRYHELVPPHTRVEPSQHEVIMKRLMVASKHKLPAIRYHEDMQARLLGLYPGDIVEIARGSITAGVVTVYRHCA